MRRFINWVRRLLGRRTLKYSRYNGLRYVSVDQRQEALRRGADGNVR